MIILMHVRKRGGRYSREVTVCKRLQTTFDTVGMRDITETGSGRAGLNLMTFYGRNIVTSRLLSYTCYMLM